MLLDELQQHRENLQALELRRARYGLDAPLELLNAIRYEESEIERIEQELADCPHPTPLPGGEGTREGEAVRRRMMEARFASMETTLRSMENKIDSVQGQIHGLDTRMIRLESRLEHIERQMAQQVTAPVSRQVLGMFGAAVMVMLILMIVITWQVL